ncbi:endonuclease/exonuclease/phosphatase family protein [Aquabacter spiritensis]|uniref:Endonuclease/exonuclease/phosphatase family metal-dependent hydrolase n=1 Tax=Aquabacter spiritensis TaxID=933073 RepID=A0A4R3LTI2_9HYPH|nr:endonuclease/exonuclease/phosphatase family protein [Aquabacter spiritensis]TCT03206.1 endonuclease/exonuclease/phosphatase family metal-dependent hydrolase [Aquabacter spiritensis]
MPALPSAPPPPFRSDGAAAPQASPQATARLRIVTYNVRRCYGLDGRYAPGRIAEILAESAADVVALQELDVRRARSGGIDQAVAIASELRMNLHFHPAMRVVEELYGDAILSLLPLELKKAGPLPGTGGALRTEPRGALWVEARLAGTPVQIINTHFGLLARERLLQAEAIAGPDWLGHSACRGPTVLVGDLNSGPGSRAYRRIAAKLTDAQRANGRRPVPTFPTRWPILRIDHVFVGGGIGVERVATLRGGAARLASDHVPLCVDLTVPAAATSGPERSPENSEGAG